MDLLLKSMNYKENSTRIWIAILVVFLILVSWSGVLDTMSTEYIDSALIQSAVAFGVARGINALVSVLQSTEISFQLGAGVSLGIGEVLDPINDLVEQYSSLMKLSIGSLVIQKLLVEIVSDTFFKILITFSGLLLLASFFYKNAMYVNVFAKTFIFLFFIRFILVLVIILNGVVDRAFIQDKTDKEIVALNTLTEEVRAIEKNIVMDEDLRVSLNSELDTLNNRNVVIKQDIVLLEARINTIDSELTSKQTELEELQAQRGWSRLNPLTSDEELSRVRDERKVIRSELNSIRDEKSLLDRELVSNQNRIKEIENTLQGIPNNLRESLGQRVGALGDKASSLASNVKLSQIKEKLEESVASMVNVMTLFVFKTLILPLIFLFMLMKGTNLIWGVDVRSMIKNESSNFLNSPKKVE